MERTESAEILEMNSVLNDVIFGNHYGFLRVKIHTDPGF